MENWKEKAKRIGATVYFFDPNLFGENKLMSLIDGFAICDKERGIKVAFINNSLSKKKMLNVIHHELEHLANEDRKFSFSVTSHRIEAKSNYCMVEESADDYVVNYGEVDDNTCVDINNFLESYDLSKEFYGIAQAILTKKFGERYGYEY